MKMKKVLDAFLCLFFPVSLQWIIVVLSNVPIEWYGSFPVVFPSEWWEAVSSKWTTISCWIMAVEQRFQNPSQIIVWVLLAPCSSSLIDRGNFGLALLGHMVSLASGLRWRVKAVRWGVSDLQVFLSPFGEGHLAIFPSIWQKYFLWKKEFGACWLCNLKLQALV